MSAYYNEFDPKAAAWLRELIKDGLIAPGEVDERSIADVRPDDLRGFSQCHFFAGIGGWSLALRLAEWPDDRHGWTGSCPCQPFSGAGARQGHADARHLWPEFFRLIAECRPPVVFGEQVAGADARAWLAAVRLDLETVGYAVGGIDTCAAGVGAPHIRQRLFWVAESEYAERGPEQQQDCLAHGRHGLRRSSDLGWVAEPTDGRTGRATEAEPRCDQPQDRIPRTHRPTDGADALPAGRPEGGTGTGGRSAAHSGESRGLGHGIEPGLEGHAGHERDGDQPGRLNAESTGSVAPTGGLGCWSDLVWLPCQDGTYRPTQSTIQPLAHGVPGRVGLLRGAGNAIVPQVAAAFLRAYLGA